MNYGGQMKGDLARASHLREALEEVVGGRDGELESQHLQNELFHAEHLLLGVGVVGNVNELANLGRVDLLVFTAMTRRKNVSRRMHDRLPQTATYAATNMAAVPTSCNFPRSTDMCDRKRSMNETAK